MTKPWPSLVVASSLALAGAARAAPRPNLVLILADDFGYELVGANGGESYKTPHLDRLAATGIRFEHCYAQPLCTPTRVQLLTGRYNQRNYVRFAHLDPGERTFAQVLRDAGYKTCAAGKWQLAGDAGAPRRFGFDEHLLWHLTVRKSRYANPVLERDGRVVEHTGGEYGPDVVADFIVDFLRRHRDRPFCVFHPMLLTHAPFEPTPGSAAWDPRARGGRMEGGGERGDPRHFADMVAHADRVVGRIVAALEELGLRQNTLVLFTGDNGTARAIASRFAGREVRGGKGEMTDAGTRVPLIASWPGTIPEGRVSRDLVDSTDFFPTLLEAAGVAAPASLALDGRSFLPQLRGERGAPREWAYSWYARDGGPVGREWARTQRFKLYGDGSFFDVASDPGERSDLAPGQLTPEASSARALLADALGSFAGTRLEALGASVFRQGGRVIEVILDGREVSEGMMDAIAGFADLTDLSLERSGVGDAHVQRLTEPGKLAKLEWLNLFRTRITDAALADLSRLPHLKLLPIGETGVTDAGLVHLERLTRLEYLGLRGDRVTDAGLAHVAKLTALKGLHLGGTGVTDEGVARLRALARLEKLWLDDTAVSDAAVEHLAALGKLKELHVAGTRLSPRGLERLRAALPECQVEAER